MTEKMLPGVDLLLEGTNSEEFSRLPGPFRMLLGLDGTLTRSLTFLTGEEVGVELVTLPGNLEGVRKVYLRVPSSGRLVFARTRLLPTPALKRDSWIESLMKGDLAIGQSMEARYGPLVKDQFVIFSVSEPYDPEVSAGSAVEGPTWARSYRMSTSGGLSLRIEEFFLPSLLRLSGG